MSSYVWLLFVIGTALCWGAYGPAIHEGQMGLNKNPWKAFLLVGVAYFFVAVLVPLLVIKFSGVGFRFELRGTSWALTAGVLGALGALFVIAALKFGGKPLHVMPLVFGLAPVVNVVVSSILHRAGTVSPMLYVGCAVLAIGAGMVLYFKPTG